MFRVWDLQHKQWYRGAGGWVGVGQIYKTEAGARSSIGDRWTIPELEHLRPVRPPDSTPSRLNNMWHPLWEKYHNEGNVFWKARREWYKKNSKRPFNEIYAGKYELVPYGEKPKDPDYTGV